VTPDLSFIANATESDSLERPAERAGNGLP
jgi:hypothetical protein